jgi:hypothetical protein
MVSLEFGNFCVTKNTWWREPLTNRCKTIILDSRGVWYEEQSKDKSQNWRLIYAETSP